RVRFFARYAELAGRSEGTLTVPLPATVSDVMKQIRATWPGASALPAQPLAALNLRHVRLDARISDGDELALLPPLAGG
ncbi:MAG TPA: MoaD/ThiS family protein, partial [Gemmatimonadales bacterium]|nr:MoaD/ThiS family protein [Gemmatimonadales bacterium]